MKDLNSLLEHVHEHLRSRSIFQIYIYVNGHINVFVFVHMCACTMYMFIFMLMQNVHARVHCICFYSFTCLCSWAYSCTCSVYTCINIIMYLNKNKNGYTVQVPERVEYMKQCMTKNFCNFGFYFLFSPLHLVEICWEFLAYSHYREIVLSILTRRPAPFNVSVIDALIL